MKLVTLTLCGVVFISPAVAQTTNCRPLLGGSYECDNGLTARPLPGGRMQFSDGVTSRRLPDGNIQFNSDGTRAAPEPGKICVRDVYGRYNCR